MVAHEAGRFPTEAATGLPAVSPIRTMQVLPWARKWQRVTVGGSGFRGYVSVVSFIESLSKVKTS